MGKSTEKLLCCHSDQQPCRVPKNTNLKTQSETRWELQEGGDRLCVTLCVCVVMVKKEEVKDSEYIPTGMKLRDKPMWLSALQQSEGVVVVPLEKEGKYPALPRTCADL